jgi:pimeloyl-ACP methyl ester carboxylesterase
VPPDTDAGAPALGVHAFPGRRPVLLVHGLGRSALLDWVEPGWPRALAAAGRGAIAVDLPGHGSCPAAPPAAVSVSAIVAALAATIDATGQEQADVVGYSLGARLAWPLAATGRVRRLVLGGLRPDDPMAGLDIGSLAAVVRGEAQSPQPKLTRLAGRIARAADPDSMLRLVEALSAQLFDPAVDVPTVPTLFVAGADDRRLDQLAATLPAAAHLVVPGDHHGALLSPDFRAAVLDFIG